MEVSLSDVVILRVNVVDVSGQKYAYMSLSYLTSSLAAGLWFYDECPHFSLLKLRLKIVIICG
jgi:hypothetical protein